jgi:hypothetical protein
MLPAALLAIAPHKEPATINAAAEKLPGDLPIGKFRQFQHACCAFLLMCGIGVTLFYLCGGSLDGIFYGHWPVNLDHPTNWLDSIGDRPA